MSATTADQMKRAVQAIAQLRKRLASLQSRQRAPIAVVGIGCRFPPGLRGPDAFFDALVEGQELVGDVPSSRWDVDALHDPTGKRPGSIISRRGAFLNEIDRFDPAFFGIAPREARRIDSQESVF